MPPWITIAVIIHVSTKLDTDLLQLRDGITVSSPKCSKNA